MLHPQPELLKCSCFTSTETVGLLGTGAQDVHLDFHTAPAEPALILSLQHSSSVLVFSVSAELDSTLLQRLTSKAGLPRDLGISEDLKWGPHISGIIVTKKANSTLSVVVKVRPAGGAGTGTVWPRQIPAATLKNLAD